MSNHWEKFWLIISQWRKKIYQLLTHRYRYKALQSMCINTFWMIFKIMLYCCCISYLISIPGVRFRYNYFFFAEIWSIKNFFLVVSCDIIVYSAEAQYVLRIKCSLVVPCLMLSWSLCYSCFLELHSYRLGNTICNGCHT